MDAEFPGGNIILEGIEGDVVKVRQDLRDTEGDWFYWQFRVRGAAGRTPTFQFAGSRVIGVRGPAVSTDQGNTWAWLGADAVRGNSFTYAFPKSAGEVRFSMNIPYMETHLNQFLVRHRGDPRLKTGVLTRTGKGREVELLHVGRQGGGARYKVMLTSRHHACESLATYTLEGILETVLSDTKEGAWLRENAEFLAVPFVDKDGVEDGDQGKNRRPRDHNRDYDGQSVHASVRAIREQAPRWSEGKLRIALDLHCPGIRGENHEEIYFVGSPDQAMWTRVLKFATLLEKTQRGPLVYRTANNIPFGKAWNTADSFKAGMSNSRWAAGLPGMVVATSIEIPYANAGGEVVTADSARAFGADLARAIRVFLGK